MSGLIEEPRHPPAQVVLSYFFVLGLSWVSNSELDQPWLSLTKHWFLQGSVGRCLLEGEVGLR